MKRTALLRKTPLRSRPKPRPQEPGRAEWKAVRLGRCAVCKGLGKVIRHHIYYEQHCRREHGDPWDLRNSLDLGAYCNCHALHHTGLKRIPLELVPVSALEFMTDLIGDERTAIYLKRYYDCTAVTT